jgi:hypothetical protein
MSTTIVAVADPALGSVTLLSAVMVQAPTVNDGCPCNSLA